MAGRNWVMAAMVVGTLVLGACGSDEAKDGGAVDVTSVDDGGATAATDASGDATTETAVADGTGDTLVDDGSSADGDATVTGDPTLFALTALPVEQVCAMLPKDQAEGVVGSALDEGSGMQVEGLGTNCVYNLADTFDIGAKLEFSVFSWEAVVSLSSITMDGVPKTEECTVADRAALCTPEYELNGFATGAQVYVKLGEDGDVTLLTQAAGEIDAAKQLAEIALANLHL